jgi:hypothetical protein
MRIHALLMLVLLAAVCARADELPVAEQKSEQGIRHGVLVSGAETFLLDVEGKTVWTYPLGTRDGWVLPNGHFLLDVSRGGPYPHGAILEVNREGKTLFEFQGTQSEVDCLQPLPGGHVLLTESGAKPRLMEIDRAGKILVEFPLKCQTNDPHMQTRMARKLANGHYLVPHLMDKVVREYDAKGEVVWEVTTPDWPFTAVRLDNGNTLINCTRGNTCIEVDKAGKIVWQVTNADLSGEPIHDACGVQRLPNGDTVIESYGANDPNAIKLFEVTRDKKIVWTLRTFRAHGLHEFQLLDAAGKPLKGRQLR